MTSIDCDHIFGATKVEKVDAFRIDGGEVDFGDELHLAGVPQGEAVVCWRTNGRVTVLGKLFSDNFRDTQVASIEFRFRRTNGQTATARARVASQSFWVASKSIEASSPSGRFNQVRIRLFKFQHTDLGDTPRVRVAERTFNR